MPFWHPSVGTYVKVVRVKINDSNVATILGSSLLTDGCRRGVQTWTRPHIRVSALFLFLSSPVAVRTGHLPLSHLEGGVGEEAQVRLEGTRGGSRSGRFAELSSYSSQLLVHVQKLRRAFMRVCVCVHQSPNLSSCVWFCIHVIWGGFFLVVVFFPFLLLLLLLPVCPDTLFCALEALYGQIMDGSCFVSAALPLFLSFHFIWLFYFQQCFKFRRKDIHALFLIAHLCLPCYFCHLNFFFFGFQSSFFLVWSVTNWHSWRFSHI